MVTDLVPNVYDPACPTRAVLDRVGDRWTSLVVLHLASGPMRFTRLRAAIGGVAPKVLTQTLRAMERDGLLSRTVHAEVPPRVDYELTELGHSLRTPIQAITDWAEAHMAEVVASRADYDAARDER
ncbi:helix-turn-helix domain-containing protein [Saccharopolyspora gloriosae]|uniref:DNA-binding HxlR family transcriptional regulator n=1 Tax=Saccharopolyspora gloriosae TaxID=455344 RepID=A0A840N5K5_9PSEU|nr:DNA-binding HxlR family transcriptional regulator [Saccharopolyspora gloriosae]